MIFSRDMSGLCRAITAVFVIAVLAVLVSTRQGVAQVVFATYQGGSANAASAQGFGNGALVPGETVEINASGPPGSVVRVFVGAPEVFRVTIPAGGQIIRQLTVPQNYSGNISVLTTNTAPGTAVNFIVRFLRGNAPGGASSGQAAADQIRANAENFIPGLNGLNDLFEVFGVPPQPVDVPTPTPSSVTGVAVNGGQNVGGQNVIGAGAPVRVARGGNAGRANPGANPGANPAANPGGQVVGNDTCEEELARLEALLAEKQAEVDRILDQLQLVSPGEEGDLDRPEDLQAAVEKFLKAAQDGPGVINPLDVLIAKALLDAPLFTDPLEVGQRQLLLDEESRLERSLDVFFEDIDFRKSVLGNAEENLAATLANPSAPEALSEQERKVVESRLESLAEIVRLKDERVAQLDDTRKQIKDLTERGETGKLKAAFIEAQKRVLAQLEAKHKEKFEELAAEFNALQAQVSAQRKKCEDEKSSDAGGVLAPAQRPVRVATAPAVDTVIAADAGGLSLTFSTQGSDTGLDPRLGLFVKGTLTFHDDNRTGVGQDGETYALAGGMSWALPSDTKVGVVLRYGRTDLSGTSGTTQADTASIGAFVQRAISDRLRFEMIGAYTASDIKAVFVQPAATTTGRPKIESFASQARLTGRIDKDGLIIEPSIAASYVHVHQSSFAMSDGTIAPGDTSDRLSIIGGATFSRTYPSATHGTWITPSFGLNGIVNLDGRQSFLLANGSTSRSGRYGVVAKLGVQMRADSGAVFGLNGTASAFEGGQNSFTLSISAQIPLD